MPPLQSAQELIDYINASPTPFHCVKHSADMLQSQGYSELKFTDDWHVAPGDRVYFKDEGHLFALHMGSEPPKNSGFRIIGAHTDSPNLKLKPKASLNNHGYKQIAAEPYGGLLTYTWFDRDLGLAGAVVYKKNNKAVTHLLRMAEPKLRLPSLAIHMNRDIRTDGFKPNHQEHVNPLFGLFPQESKDDNDFLNTHLATEIGCSPDSILSWNLSLYDLMPATFGGENNAFVYAPRLDNQAMCHAGLASLLAQKETPKATSVVCLYDHEEVGSTSTGGADSTLLSQLLCRISDYSGPKAEPGAWLQSASKSIQISADMAHAVHPNYSDKHEKNHRPKMNEGPVIKLNANQRYATTATTSAVFSLCCQRAEIPCQSFVNRGDLPCGSTIGPMSSAQLAIATVDVGNAMLSMHSIREQCGSLDHAMIIKAFEEFYRY